MRKRTTVACIALLATGLWACDNKNNETDAGHDGGQVTPDGGPLVDGGPVADAGADSGTPDAGPPPTFQVRLVNDIPGYPAVDLCLWQSTEATGPIADTGQWLTQTQTITFRGVSPYLPFDYVEGLDYAIALYPAGAITTACPSTPTADGAPTAALIATVPFASLSENGVFSAIATGFAPGTLGAADDALPSICNPATFTAPCPETAATQLLLVEDDTTAPAAGKARIRVSSQIPNIAPVGFNVCYDPDLVPDTTTAGHCLEAASTVEPVALASNVTYGTVTDYNEIDPIQPMNATLGIGGGIYLVPETTGSTGCTPFTDLPAEQQRCYPILAAFPPPAPPDNIRPNVAEGDISTIFISGAFGLSGSDATDYGPKFFIWQDNLSAP